MLAVETEAPAIVSFAVRLQLPRGLSARTQPQPLAPTQKHGKTNKLVFYCRSCSWRASSKNAKIAPQRGDSDFQAAQHTTDIRAEKTAALEKKTAGRRLAVVVGSQKKSQKIPDERTNRGYGVSTVNYQKPTGRGVLAFSGQTARAPVEAPKKRRNQK